MITIRSLLCALLFLLLNSLLHQVLGHNDQLNKTSSWLKNPNKPSTMLNWRKQKPPMCKPWTCERSGPPMARMRCCRNQCTDVLYDPNHCRFCFKKCQFSLSCCDGDCVDTNNDPSNCGQCGNECESGALCEFGMCGYADDPSPQPRKRHRRRKFHRPHPPPSPDSNGRGELHDDRDNVNM